MGLNKKLGESYSGLSPTEERIISFLLQGLSIPQIAIRLFRAQSTIHAHIGHVRFKLDLEKMPTKQLVEYIREQRRKAA